MPPVVPDNVNTANSCGFKITPDCIKALYNLHNNTLAAKGNGLGIFEWQDEAYAQEDLNQFYKAYAPNIPTGTGPVLISINHGVSPTDPAQAGGEASIDYQMAIPIVYPQTTINHQVNPVHKTGGLDLFESWLDAVDSAYCSADSGDSGTVALPNVVSFPWDDSEPQWSAKYLHAYLEFDAIGASVIPS